MKYAIRHGYMLVEMTEQQFNATDPNSDVRPVSANEAHRHVREGGIHETYLWVNSDGRVRRASPG